MTSVRIVFKSLWKDDKDLDWLKIDLLPICRYVVSFDLLRSGISWNLKSYWIYWCWNLEFLDIILNHCFYAKCYLECLYFWDGLQRRRKLWRFETWTWTTFCDHFEEGDHHIREAFLCFFAPYLLKRMYRLVQIRPFYLWHWYGPLWCGVISAP